MSAVNFDEWCLEHGKVYNGELDKKVRKSVFASNVRLVESLNQQYNSRYYLAGIWHRLEIR